MCSMTGEQPPPSHFYDDPLMNSAHTVKRTKATPAGDSGNNDQAGAPLLEVTEQKGDLLIRGLCQNGTASVHDMRVVSTNDKSHQTK